MFDTADKFLFAGWIEYLANFTTLVVNVGLIFAAIWAWQHWGKVGEILKRIEQLVREAVDALRDYAIALREASRPPPPKPPADTQPAAAAPSPLVAPAVASPSPPPPRPPAPPPASDVKVSPPGCLGYMLTAVVLVVFALLARYCTTPPVVEKVETPPEVSVPAEPATPAPTARQEPWTYPTRVGDSCWAIAERAASGDAGETTRLWLAIIGLNPNYCPTDRNEIVMPDTPLRMPAEVAQETLSTP